ncbi:MAG: hypothetical protein ACM30G_19595 [Micromonosporaceae bacterium]
MRRMIVGSVLVLVALAGCARGLNGPGGPGISPSGAGASTPPGGEDTQSPPSTTPKGVANLSSAARVEIFSAMLRRYLTTPDNSFSDVPPFLSVWMLDHTDPSAGDPMSGPRTGEPITATEQAAIRAALADVLPVKFVSDRSQVIETVDGCARVRDGGVLITVGPPRGGPDRVEVAINGFVACLGATWFTYVVVRQAGGWAVTGTTGPVAIA